LINWASHKNYPRILLGESGHSTVARPVIDHDHLGWCFAAFDRD
jgi:hypothetical protein